MGWKNDFYSNEKRIFSHLKLRKACQCSDNYGCSTFMEFHFIARSSQWKWTILKENFNGQNILKTSQMLIKPTWWWNLGKERKHRHENKKIPKNERTNEQTKERASERIAQKFMNEILSKTREIEENPFFRHDNRHTTFLQLPSNGHNVQIMLFKQRSVPIGILD